MKKYKRILKWAGIVLLVIITIAATLYMIYLRPFVEKMKHTEIINPDSKLTIITGGGGNSGILVSDSLVIVIDTKMDEAAQLLYEKVKQLAGNKPILVINTHFHPDHIGGNALYQGSKIMAGSNYGKETWLKEADEKTLPNWWLKDSLTINMDDEKVTVLNLAKDVHTESDIVVYLNKRKLLFAGDIILNKQAPVLMGKANPEGYLWAFDWLKNNFDIQKIVPGHGEIGDSAILNNYKTYFQDMKTASVENNKKDELISKYKQWGQLPIFMSPEATIRAFKRGN